MRKPTLRRTLTLVLIAVLLLHAVPAVAAPYPDAPDWPIPPELDADDFAALWATMHPEPPAPMVASAVGTPSAEPTIPAGLDGYAGSRLITLWWDDDPAAAFFRLYRKKSVETSFSLLDFTPEAIYEDDTVTNGVSYDYCVSAVSSIGVETAKSTTITLTPGAPPVYRISGGDRYETCVEISKTNFSSASKVVLVSGAGFVDALSASALCGVHKSPLLLTEPGAVPDAVMSEIARLGATEVLIVGGSGVVSSDVVTQLQGAGLNVTRIGGTNRYDTAARVATYVVANGGDPTAVFICRSDDYADALSIAPFAYQYKTPVLLIGFDTFPFETFDAMNDLTRKVVVLIGGEKVLPTELLGWLWYPYMPPSDALWARLWGQDRYYTSVAVAQAFEALEYPMLGVATGSKFPDALSGGVACGSGKGALLLASPTDVNLGVRALVDRYKGRLTEIQVFGGTGVLSSRVADRLESAVD